MLRIHGVLLVEGVLAVAVVCLPQVQSGEAPKGFRSPCPEGSAI